MTYTWGDVLEVAHRISYQGIQDEIEHKEIRDLCMNATPHQRGYLYNNLKSAGYSDATLCYFFSSTPTGIYNDTTSTGDPILIWVNA